MCSAQDILYSPANSTIDYKRLRRINPETARRTVWEYLKSNLNVSQTALMFGINRSVVYNIVKKDREDALRDWSRASRPQPEKTLAEVENKVIEVKNRTHLGPEWLSRCLQEHEGLSVPVGTIRHILRRNRKRITYPICLLRVRKGKR